MHKFNYKNVNYNTMFSSVSQSLSRVPLFAIPWTAARQAFLSIINSQSLLKLISTGLVVPSNHLILCRPLLLPPSIFPSIRVFSNESALQVRWPKYWSFSFNNSPSNEHPGLICSRMDWLDLLAAQDIRMLITHTHTHTHTRRMLITMLCIIEGIQFNIRGFFIWINIHIHRMEFHKIIKKQVYKIGILFS